MVGRVQGKVALVTGAAQGIGAATARLLAREGASVMVSDINAAGAQGITEEIRASGGTAHGYSADMGQKDEISALIDETVKTYGRIDILVNNAAAVRLVAQSLDTNVVDIDIDVWEESLRVNLTGVMLASRFAIPHMLKQGGGAIVAVSSMASFGGSGIHPSYDVTKAGVNALVRSIAVAWGKQGIRCNAIAPGLTLSPSVLGHFDPEQRQIYLDWALTPRIGAPEDQASAILFLASEESAYINGCVLPVDGGTGILNPVMPALSRMN